MIADKIFPKTEQQERFIYDGPMPPDTIEHLKDYMKARYGMSGADTLRIYDLFVAQQPLLWNK